MLTADRMFEMLQPTLAVLSAMITPAVLLSACGTLILSTSNRLGRVVDRIRKRSEELDELSPADHETEATQERVRFIMRQLKRLMRRARLLQRGLQALYVSVCLFVSTSVAIGLSGIAGARESWIPVALGILGACLLFYASVLLMIEARIAVGSLALELDFLWQQGKIHASREMLEEVTKGGV